MSARALDYVWRQVRDLSPAQRLVLLKLADNVDDHGEGACMRHATIAADCEVSRATVKRALSQLRETGVLVVQASPSRGRSPTYSFPALAVEKPSVLGAKKGAQIDPPSSGKGGSSIAPLFGGEGGSFGGDSDLLVKNSTYSTSSQREQTGVLAFPLVKIWNDGCEGFPPLVSVKCVRPQLRGRMSRALQIANVAVWHQAMRRVKWSWFCRGDRGWVADFEWFLKKGNLAKIMAGKYDNSGRERTTLRKRARDQCSRSGWQCDHTTCCRGREEHLDRVTDALWLASKNP